jgi:hypothetical protein
MPCLWNMVAANERRATRDWERMKLACLEVLDLTENDGQGVLIREIPWYSSQGYPL